MDKKSYYASGADKYGPFSYEELKNKIISRTTKVWFDELGQEWKEAGSVAELNDLFKLMPPPLVTASRNTDLLDDGLDQRPPKTWLVESILTTLFCCMPFGIAGIVNASKVESLYYSGNVKAANQASANAKKWTMISLWIGLVGIVLYFILIGITASF